MAVARPAQNGNRRHDFLVASGFVSLSKAYRLSGAAAGRALSQQFQTEIDHSRHNSLGHIEWRIDQQVQAEFVNLDIAVRL